MIDAGVQQIFTVESNLSNSELAWSVNTISYPEWFGAIPDSVTDCGPAIQKCLDVFHHNIWLTGWVYRVKNTLLFSKRNTLMIHPSTVLIPDSDENKVLFKITKEPFVIDGGVIRIEPGYNNWIFDVEIERGESGDVTPRYASRISNIIVKGHLYGQTDFSGLSYNGIKIKSHEEHDYSYFSVMTAVDFYRPDTAIFLSGHPTSGMSNSWHWSNITVDWSMHGIVLDSRAAGHVFSNLVIQPSTKMPTTLIDIAGRYNSFSGMIWDIFSEQSIILRQDASNNWFNSMGHVDLYNNYVDDQTAYKSLNVFSTSNPFEPTTNHYSYYAMDRMMLGIKDNRSSNVPRFTVYSPSNSDAVVASFIEKWYGVGGNSNLETTTNLKPSINLQSRTSNSSMINGFGTGITFSIKDSQSDSTKYNQDIISRIYARRDGADNKGLIQFFTKGSNASSPSMTIRSTGKVGVGTTDPKSTFQVNGGIQVGDDQDAASANKVGTVRYRSDANNSYIEMCVQTGTSTYAWIIIHQESW